MNMMNEYYKGTVMQTLKVLGHVYHVASGTALLSGSC